MHTRYTNSAYYISSPIIYWKTILSMHTGCQVQWWHCRELWNCKGSGEKANRCDFTAYG